MEFQPAKCIALTHPEDPDEVPLSIYSTPLPYADTAVYLGIPFSSAGLLFERNFTKRCEKARNTAASLHRMGMNLTGFPQSASATLYKSFVRPVFEYGLALKTNQTATLDSLRRTQSFALRLIFSAQRNTSLNAMQKLLVIEPIATRNLILNLKFAARLHNSNDSRIPAVKIWRSSWATNASRSICWFARKNPLRPRANLLPIFGRTLAPQNSVPEKAFTPAVQKAILHESIRNLDRGNPNVAGSITCRLEEGYRHCLRPYAFISDQIRVPVLRWLIGNVAIHMPCTKPGCRTTISRQHAASCSGAHQALAIRYPQEASQYQQLLATNPQTRSTLIDLLLNNHCMTPPAPLYSDIASAISMIFETCLGYRQKANGFFVPASEVTSEEPPSNSLAPPLQRLPPRPRRPG
jgi:hypothetical protein